MKYAEIIIYYIKKNKIKFLFLAFTMGINISISMLLVVITTNLFDCGITQGDVTLILKLVFFYLIFGLIVSMCEYISNMLSIKIGVNIGTDLRKKIIINISELSGKEFQQIKSGDILLRTLSEIEKIQSYISQVVIVFIFDIFYTIAFGGILFKQSALLTVLDVSIMIALTLFVSHNGIKVKKATYDTRHEYQKLSNNIHQYVNNIMDVIASSSIKYIHKYIKDNQCGFINNYIKMYKIQYGIQFVQNTLEIIILILTFSIGGILVVNNVITIGILMTFNLYIGKLFSPVASILKNYVQFKELSIYLERISEILNMKPSTQDSGKKIIKRCELLEFKNTSFKYEKDYIFKDLSFKVQVGKMVGIYGRSGAGKSTIINLLIRLWNIEEGNIFIDDINIKEYSKETIRKNIAVMTQHSLIFNDTIRNNLTLCNKNISDEKIWDMIQLLKLSDYISKENGGLDRILEEDGKNLSGGQKQRICLVRTLLMNKKILILDEPTSALDTDTSKVILEFLESSKNEHITIIITHNPSLREYFDEVINI